MSQDTATALLGLGGVEVVEVDVEPDGGSTVWVVTADPDAAVCPGCRERSSVVKDEVCTRPVDVRYGLAAVRLRWIKRRWECRVPWCSRRSFTESLPGLPSRCRISVRLREALAVGIGDQDRSVAEVAGFHGVSWPTAHRAFAGHADAVVDVPAEPVAVLGIDETRRGRVRWEKDGDTGAVVVLADRWHTGFTDIAGGQGLLGQVEGRTADDAAYWLASQPPAWRHRVEAVVIDMCTIYKSAVRRMLPHAGIAVDFFHIVQLANKAVADVRRRATREKYGRRGRSGDPEYGIKKLLQRNIGDLTPEQRARLVATLFNDPHHHQVLITWIAKEKLRDLINLRRSHTGSTPAESAIRDKLTAFLTFCADHDDIPELLTLARTIDRWAAEIACAVRRDISNAKSEGYNRIVKLQARKAYGFRNPANQRRRVRYATTRTHRRSHTATTRPTQTVTGRQHDPG